MSKLFIFNTETLSAVFTNHKGKSPLIYASIIFILMLLAGFYCEAQSPVQLAPPLLKYHSVFFKKAADVEIKFAQQGTQIQYTLNNQLPTEQSEIYTKSIHINKSFTTVKAFVSGDGFLPSEIVTASFIKDGIKIKSVQQSPANKRFRGSGATALIDNEGGITDMNASTWLGYQEGDVEINMLLAKKQALSSVLINCLQNQGSWIFLPAQISVFYFDESKQSFELLGEQLNAPTEKISTAFCQPIIIAAAKKKKTKKIKIILKGIKNLPEWHAGKGQPGWLFIDEIKLY